jgi:hypothetical protein
VGIPVRLRRSRGGRAFTWAGFLAAALLVALAVAVPARAGSTGPQSIERGQVLRGRFVLVRHLQGFARPLQTEGSFALAPGFGLIWKSEKPFQGTTVISPSGIVQLSGNEEAMRLPASQMPALSKFYQALATGLSGDVLQLRDAFAVKKDVDGDRWSVTLTPLPAPMAPPFQSLTLRGERFVDSVGVTREGGDSDNIEFSDQAVTIGRLTDEEMSLLATLDK